MKKVLLPFLALVVLFTCCFSFNALANEAIVEPGGGNIVIFGDSWSSKNNNSISDAGNNCLYTTMLAQRYNLKEYNFAVWAAGFITSNVCTSEYIPYNTIGEQYNVAMNGNHYHSAMTSQEILDTKIVLILGGWNDANYNNINSSKLKSAVGSFVSKCLKTFSNATVILAFGQKAYCDTLLPNRSQYYKVIKAVNKYIAKKYPTVCVLDDFSGCLPLKSSYFLQDQLHPNNAGQQYLATWFASKIKVQHNYVDHVCTKCGKINRVQTPSITSIGKGESGGIKISWNAVSGVGSYIIYRKSGNGQYTKYATTSETTFCDYGVTPGTTYSYGIACANYSGVRISALSSKKNFILLDAPKITRVNSGNKCIGITWSGVTGSKGYKIYRRAKGESTYICIATVKNSCSYNDYTAQAGIKYAYYVKAFAKTSSGNSYSNRSGVRTAKR